MMSHQVPKQLHVILSTSLEVNSYEVKTSKTSIGTKMRKIAHTKKQIFTYNLYTMHIFMHY